jgi:hypothetical protein
MREFAAEVGGEAPAHRRGGASDHKNRTPEAFGFRATAGRRDGAFLAPQIRTSPYHTPATLGGGGAPSNPPRAARGERKA